MTVMVMVVTMTMAAVLLTLLEMQEEAGQL